MHADSTNTSLPLLQDSMLPNSLDKILLERKELPTSSKLSLKSRLEQ